MLLPVFVSPFPQPPPPQESAETVAASAAAEPVDFEAMDAEKTTAQKRNACSAVHPSNWPFAKQALNASLVIF
jgi:hypothetical protein